MELRDHGHHHIGYVNDLLGSFLGESTLYYFPHPPAVRTFQLSRSLIYTGELVPPFPRNDSLEERVVETEPPSAIYVAGGDH